MNAIRKLNPYLNIVLIFGLAIIAYFFHWSSIYPKFSIGVISFLVVFLLSAFLIGRWTSPFFDKQRHATIHSAFELPNVFIALLLIFVAVGTLLDRMYSGGFPLFGQVQYDSFGVPTLHAITIVIAVFLSIYSAQLICLKRHVKWMMIVFIVSVFPSLLGLSRGTLIMSFAMFVWIFLLSNERKIGWKENLLIFLVSILALYGFGLAGNYRLDKQVETNSVSYTDSSLIYQIGSADSRLSSTSPLSPFFWSYLYLTSPLANLQSAVNSNTRFESSKDNSIGRLFVTQYLPDAISTHIYPDYKEAVTDYGYSTRVNANLNVATTFYESFLQAGWLGMLVMAVMFLIFGFIYLYLIVRIQPGYYIMSMAVLNMMYLLAIFDNPWAFSALSLQLLIIFIFSLCSKIHIKWR